jgi:hypothetical protein
MAEVLIILKDYSLRLTMDDIHPAKALANLSPGNPADESHVIQSLEKRGHLLFLSGLLWPV